MTAEPAGQLLARNPPHPGDALAPPYCIDGCYYASWHWPINEPDREDYMILWAVRHGVVFGD